MSVLTSANDGLLSGSAEPSGPIEIPCPYLVFLGETTDPSDAKTGFGLRDWAADRCLAEYALPGATVSIGLPGMSPGEAYAKGARSIVIGVANTGGVIGEAWINPLVSALEAGLDIVSGMHRQLSDIPALKIAAARHHRRLIDIRRPPMGIPIASGRKRTGRRLLTVGTDCALGKKYTALALARAFNERGISADFRATGQTGIMIAGGGIPMDSIVSDFAAGAAEMLSPDAHPEHWDVVEGQGSLFHPSYAGVSLALLHGTQPDVVIVCHDPGRTELLGHPGYALPSIEAAIDLTLRLGSRTNPAIRCGGVSLNTSSMSEEQAVELMAFEAQRLRLPVADPMRPGNQLNQLVAACLG